LTIKEQTLWKQYINAGTNKEKIEKAFTAMKLDEIERKLIINYGLNLQQIKWRKTAIQNRCNGDINTFYQEYPSCPEEAFLSTGTPVFENFKVLEHLKMCRTRYSVKETAPQVGDVFCEQDSFGDCKAKTATFRPNINGDLTVYKEPIKGRPYVIGVDTAEGGVDFSVMQVLDNVTGEQVATWRGHTDSDLLARYAFALGEWYENALIGIETNKDKHPVKELARMGYRKIYMRETHDRITQQIKPAYGFETTSITRPSIIG